MKVLLSSILLTCFLISCTTDHSTFPISGKIVHNQSDPASLNEDFEFTQQSFALITVTGKNSDGVKEVIYEKRIENLSSLPVEFTIDPENPISNTGKFQIKAEVFTQKSNVLFVGDLVNQYPYTFTSQTDFIEIEVFGLEHCDSEFADSFCTTRDEISANCGPIKGKSFQGPSDPPPCFGGEGCGSTGSVGFSEDTDNASLLPVNSDAIALLSYAQEESDIYLFFETNPDSIEFNLINDCSEIQHKRSGNVYRDKSLGWGGVMH